MNCPARGSHSARNVRKNWVYLIFWGSFFLGGAEKRAAKCALRAFEEE